MGAAGRDPEKVITLKSSGANASFRGPQRKFRDDNDDSLQAPSSGRREIGTRKGEQASSHMKQKQPSPDRSARNNPRKGNEGSPDKRRQMQGQRNPAGGSHRQVFHVKEKPSEPATTSSTTEV